MCNQKIGSSSSSTTEQHRNCLLNACVGQQTFSVLVKILKIDFFLPCTNSQQLSEKHLAKTFHAKNIWKKYDFSCVFFLLFFLLLLYAHHRRVFTSTIYHHHYISNSSIISHDGRVQVYIYRRYWNPMIVSVNARINLMECANKSSTFLFSFLRFIVYVFSRFLIGNDARRQVFCIPHENSLIFLMN